MPTGLLVDFWANGWGPANSLVPGDVGLLALKDAGVSLLALPDSVQSYVGVSAQVTGLLALKDNPPSGLKALTGDSDITATVT